MVSFVAVVVSDEADALELEDLTRGLADEIIASDVGAVGLKTSSPPHGAKGVDGVVDALTISTISAVVPMLIGVVRSWVGRNSRPCTVKLQGPSGVTVEVSDVNDREVAQVIATLSMQLNEPGAASDSN